MLVSWYSQSKRLSIRGAVRAFDEKLSGFEQIRLYKQSSSLGAIVAGEVISISKPR